jgi:hypothetical protein
MSAFRFEQRTCRCGEAFDALSIWPDDVKCSGCGGRDYDERIRRINEGRPYRVDSIGGMCPTQAEGEWVDGRLFYFRARHGQWWLYIDESDPVGKWDADIEGDDPTHGAMSDAEVLSILDAHAASS